MCTFGKARTRLRSGNERFRHELVEVRTSRGVMRAAMLFPKVVLEAEWAVDAPFREAMAIKRERLPAAREVRKK